MKWIANLSTRRKLMSSFTLMCVMLLLVGGIGLASLAHQGEDLDTLYAHHMVGATQLLVAETSMLNVGKTVRQAMLETDVTVLGNLERQVEAELGHMQANLDSTDKTLVTAEGRALMKRLREKVGPWAADNRQIMQLAKAGQMLDAGERLQSAARQEAELADDAAALRATKLALGARAVKDARALFVLSRNVLVALIAFAVAFAFFVGLAISNMIATPLARAEGMLAKVAEGDFTQTLEVDSKDEVGRLSASLNTAVAAMRNALLEVGQSSRSVASASSQLTGAAQGISDGAQQQASSLEETAASLEEMTSTVKQNADNAQLASQLAHGARDVAEQGGSVVGSAVEAMKEINTSSRKIADIITTIDEIAFQTNLLALNAAVEAARAGEQGRGFAVVAGEVRNLAQRSATAAKEIKTLIQDSVEKVGYGSRLVDQSGHTLGEIVVSVKKVTEIIAEIAAASREQSAGIDQVNTAVSQMDHVTQTNASQTEEMASTASALATQAQQMMALVERFHLGTVADREPVKTAAKQPAPSPAPADGPARVAPKLRVVAGLGAAAAGEAAGRRAASGDGFEEF